MSVLKHFISKVASRQVILVQPWKVAVVLVSTRGRMSHVHQRYKLDLWSEHVVWPNNNTVIAILKLNMQ